MPLLTFLKCVVRNMSIYASFVGYRTLSQSKYPSKRNEEDYTSLNAINRIVNIFTRRDFSEFLLSIDGFLLNPRQLPPDKWLSRIWEEKEYDSRPALKELLKENVGNFTIIVPNLSHIIRGNMNDITSLQMIINRSIPVLSADGALVIFDRMFNRINVLHEEGDFIHDIKKMYLDDHSELDKSLKGRLTNTNYEGVRL